MNLELDNSEWLESMLSLPPVTLCVAAWESGSVEASRADAIIEATWENQSVRFLAEIKGRSIPKVLREATVQAQVKASPPETYPMVIVPYLSADKLEQLETNGVSGVDLCGNGILTVPGKLLVFRSGKPNQFPESPKLKNTYRGMISLVARAFLIQPQFSMVKEIVELLDRRGACVAISTVSKALKRLEDDLVVSRECDKIRLIQPDTLLDKLAANYESPRVRTRFQGKCGLPTDEMARRFATAITSQKEKVALTGAASVEKYAVAAREPSLSIYTTLRPLDLLDSSSMDASETSRFANLEIIQTDDARVFCDRRNEDGVPYASPVQTYLELATGDKRQRDAAKQVRQGILASLERSRDDGRP
jgi:hypothetical protein